MYKADNRWHLLLALLALLLLASCGGGGGAAMLNGNNDKGFSLSADPGMDSSAAHLGLNVIEGADSTEVQVLGTDAQGLRDLLVHVNYDPNSYSPLSQTASPAFSAGADLLTLSVDREPGVLHFGAVQAGADVPGFSGDGVLASFIFEKHAFVQPRDASTPPALGNAAAAIDYNNLSGQISWYYANPGDTNQDGLVSLADLVPIARDFKANGPFGISSRQSVADANSDGEINISDVSVLGANWSNDAFGGFNILTATENGTAGSSVGNVPFASAVGDPTAERLRFSYLIPQGSRLAYAWVQPVDGVGSGGLSGDSIFSDIQISGPTASFGIKPGEGEGTTTSPFKVKAGDSLPFAVYDPEDGDITLDPGLAVWLEPADAGTIANGVLQVSDSYNGGFVMRGSYQDEEVNLLASKSTSGLGSGNGGYFQIDGCLELRLDDPELDGSGSIWDPYTVTTSGETLDFSVWHCDFGDISNSEMLSWGWQPENSGEFNWDQKAYTFNNDFTGLWVIEVAWEHEGQTYTDHLYFIVDPDGGNTEATLELLVNGGYESGAGTQENPYVICNTTHEVGLKAWHSQIGDVTQSEHLSWHLNPEGAGVIHPEWHQINISEGFLGNFYIEVVWESAGQRLVDHKYFTVVDCGNESEFEIRVQDGIPGEGTEANRYEICTSDMHEFLIKAWHSLYGDVTTDPHTTWSWAPEGSGTVHPEWHQFNLAEGFLGNFSIHAVYMHEGMAWEDTKFFKAVECNAPENQVTVVMFTGVQSGEGTQADPYILCSDVREYGVKGLHTTLGDVTQSEYSTWFVDSQTAGVMHPEWHQFNLAEGFLGNFAIKLVYASPDETLQNIKFFKVVECSEENSISLETDLEALEGTGTDGNPYQFCQGVEGINFQVFHSGLGEITGDSHLHWSSAPEAAGSFNADLSRFIVNYEYLGVFSVTCTYMTETETLTKTLWFKQLACELPPDFMLLVTNPPESGDGTAEHPYVYPTNPIEIGLQFLHPELGDVTQNENVIWNWDPPTAGEFRVQFKDFRVNNDFTGTLWISAGWPLEGGGTETRKVYFVIGNI